MNDSVSDFGELLAVNALLDEVDNLAKLGIVIVVVDGLIAVILELNCFGSCHAEEEHIVIAYCLVNFNVSTVESTECKSTVDHKLHITCTACFSTCKRNLLTDICGGHKSFSH